MERNYKNIKKELSCRCSSAGGFTEVFYQDYLEYRREAGKVGNYSGLVSYDKIFNSDFYQNNGSAYCEFLSIYNDTLKKFRVDLLGDGPWHDLEKRYYEYFENEDYARNWASNMGYKFYEVMEVKV